MNILSIIPIITDENHAFTFALEHCMIDLQKKCECGLPMILRHDSHYKFEKCWYCVMCHKSKTIFNESIFNYSKLRMNQMLYIVYCWSNLFSNKQTAQ